MAENGMMAFDLDFLRAIGFEFSEDWDGEIGIHAPEKINIEQMTAIIKAFAKGIKTRLYFERQKGLHVCFGGPKNGYRYSVTTADGALLFHLSRGTWAVYKTKGSDPRAWFVGYASSRKKARALVNQK